MKELLLFDIEQDLDNWRVECFSANHFSDDSARLRLEEKYMGLTEISDEFNRQSVSFQLSKQDCIHRWLKYKEGFSADLVEKLLDEIGINAGDTVLDPFMGSGTTAMVCKFHDINSLGYDVLPMTRIAIRAKSDVLKYNFKELAQLYEEFKRLQVPNDYVKNYPYIPITDGAFPKETEKAIMYYTDWNGASDYSAEAKNLVKLCILNSLETVSYTRKDGQYLSWDSRSRKMIEANEARTARGAKPINRLNKGEIPNLKDTLNKELVQVMQDIVTLQDELQLKDTTIGYKEGSCLLELPKLASESIDGVVTSPPYCNRYDYTRTYALEMNYLGMTANEINKLRQDLISCTVESKSKLDFLRGYYSEMGRLEDFKRIVNIINSTDALNEIKESLAKRNANGEINNKGILRMVDGYFTDLTFIYAEIFRILKHGASIAVVNDNVRYAGEVIPVDFLSSEIAEKIGFNVKRIYTLKQQKGNSSQQMAKYGRVALRKSITIWQKP